MDLPDFDDADPDPDLMDMKLWSEVPQPIRKIVEQHVAARLPAKILAKLRDLHARGIPISSDPAFFHFGGGLAVRNLCRERLSDDELAACCLFGDWDMCYIGVLAGIAAAPVRRSQAPVSPSRGNSSSASLTHRVVQMARGEKNWAAFFRRTDKEKKVKKKRKSASLSMVSEVVAPRVIGELNFVHSYSPIPVRKSHILTNAKKRRADPTPAETRLENVLNSLNGGVLRGKFKREHVVSGKWIVDFFFPENRLAIEVDGSVHDTQVQRAKDLKKDSDCMRFDITVLRLRNAEIFGDRDWLIKKLRTGWREAKDRENRIIGTSA